MIPTIGTIVVTTRCNFACTHCSVITSPYGKYKITEELISKFIDGLARIPSVRVVVFTGGEPTLLMNELTYGIEYATRKGFITRLVTNGWWAQSEELAFRYIRMFKAKGLREINTSYDDFRSKYVSIDNIANLVKAALDEGLRVAVGVATIKRSYYTLERVKEHISKKIGVGIEELEKRVSFIEDQPTPVGRARLLYNADKSRFDLNREKLDLGCPNIGRVIALIPNGDIKVCCGHPIFHFTDDDIFLIGNIMHEDLVSMVKRAQRKLFYWWLHFLGPKKILERIGAKEEGFTSLCHACDVILENKEYQRRIYEYMEKHKFDILLNDIILSDNIVRLENVIRSLGLADMLKKMYMQSA
jgi:MoaA/NifB/PqqE/SkfB family radical SAM enzyme